MDTEAVKEAIAADLQKHSYEEVQIFEDLKALIDHLRGVEEEFDTFKKLRKFHTQTKKSFNLAPDTSHVDKDMFDPVYRKKDFIKVRKYVIESLDLRKKSKHEIMKLKHANSLKNKVHEIQDQEQLDFLAEDPRKVGIDSEQRIRDDLQAKHEEN